MDTQGSSQPQVLETDGPVGAVNSHRWKVGPGQVLGKSHCFSQLASPRVTLGTGAGAGQTMVTSTLGASLTGERLQRECLSSGSQTDTVLHLPTRRESQRRTDVPQISDINL